MESTGTLYRYIKCFILLFILFGATPFLLFGQSTDLFYPADEKGFQGQASSEQIIRDKRVRYTVLSPYLIRLEYSVQKDFENRPTFHVLNRRFGTPDFKTSVQKGWRVIETKAMQLRHKIGSGPFSSENTKLTVNIDGNPLPVTPRFNHYTCYFGAICEAETARHLNPKVESSTYIRGDWVSNLHMNYTGTGYLNAFNNPGSTIEWEVSEIPEASHYYLHVRYASEQTSKGMVLSVNGTVQDSIAFPTTVNRQNWRTLTLPISLPEGKAHIRLRRVAKKTTSVQIDHMALTRNKNNKPVKKPVTYSGNLGGWDRGLGNESGKIPLHDGLLSREGWFLLDDTRTPIWTAARDWVQPRQRPDTYQDMYLFGYGHNYKKALKTFADLTGHPPLLPRWAFGILFSRNHPYGAKDFTNKIVPNQHNNNIPLDGLIIDTDFKAPDRWNGWNWREDLFPHPEKFLEWTREQGLKVALNIHPSINKADPQFPKADSIANGLIDARGECPRWQGMQEPCSVWNWGIPAHNKSYFALHERFEQQGVDFWWLDWCCDGSRVTMPGLTPDAWINQQYALHMEQQGKRGFSLSRIGSKWQNQSATHPGPWAEHRNSIHFTGDTYPTWEMLEFQSFFTAAEGNIGLPYVSHDIGSYHAGGPRAGELSDPLYIRWVQFGTFQPIFRVHGHGKRLPWQFDGKARKIGKKFMQLRQRLIPYIYTEARYSSHTGIPIVRSMYLRHPDRENAYEFRHQYYFGSELLVAPVAKPGSPVTKQVWLPEKPAWYHFFTNDSFAGGQTVQIESTYNHIPVLAPAGAIVPMGPYMDHVGAGSVDPLTIKIFSGSDGNYTLYEDSGEGHQYRKGQYLKTPIKYVAVDSVQSLSTIVIGPATGKGYEGQLKKRSYHIKLIGNKKPSSVRVNGDPLQQINAEQPGWTFNREEHILQIQTSDLNRRDKHLIEVRYNN